MPRMTTVVRPGHYAPGHQFTAYDYVRVPAITLVGTFTVAESARLTNDPRIQSTANARRVVNMMVAAVDRMKAKGKR